MSAEEHISRALVEGHEDLYLSNPWFRAGVDELTRLLPALVHGLALQAEQKNREREKRAAVLTAGGVRPVCDAAAYQATHHRE